MLINLSELFSVEGKSKTYEVPLDMERFETPSGVYQVADKEPVVLEIANKGKKVLSLQGRAVLSLVIPCARCLEPVKVPFDLEIDLEMDMKKTERERREELDEQLYIDGYNLDVDRLVGSELILNMPIRVLCREDCAGISDRDGTNPNSEEGGKETALDPRMSVIQDIFKQMKEV
ncbi:MAG TPA: DUF177 domain-containing protein [Candidatus Enterocloster excrementipullorum]|uniref:DUF177 domain-containing protein n=1 Tax=Candidatus Enterocloster excrementipullorum TaxID=2838559 RepID=A0A9D2N0S4_9FIRM|nr:DUF177 domain-containing protein [Candidatus Enterocloster excrementipullorum]